MINPRGSRSDGFIDKRSSTGHPSRDWDGIWEGEAFLDDKGWTAEIALPYKTLSFDPTGNTWGLNIERKIIRKNERIRWNNPTRDDKVYSLSDLGEMTGLSGLEQGLGIDIKPYMTFTNRKDSVKGTQDYSFDPGFDLFYRFTPAITGSLSINMDFAETETDLRQVNLTRYPLFFPEKRDFFLQDSNVFSFGASKSIQPFFSRRVGLDSDGNPISIKAAGKLSGRVGRFNFGLLNVQLEDQPGVGSKNLGVARASMDVGQESNVGFIKRTLHSISKLLLILLSFLLRVGIIFPHNVTSSLWIVPTKFLIDDLTIDILFTYGRNSVLFTTHIRGSDRCDLNSECFWHK